MSDPVHMATPRFHVEVKRVSDQTARAEAHGQSLELAIKGGDSTLGFTPPETLLAAFGACILSNLTRGAAEMGLHVEHAEVVLDGVKRNDPLGIEPLAYRVRLRSPEPLAALQELYRRATSDGAATNALLNGLTPTAQLLIEPGDAGSPMAAARQAEGAAR